MRTTLLLGLIVSCATFPAFAGTVLADTVACVSQKALVKYNGLMAKGHEKFAEQLIERADCFVQKDAVEAIKTAGTTPYAYVETVNGHKMWVDAVRFVEDAKKEIKINKNKDISPETPAVKHNLQ
jgi:N-acetylmuramic acid 6-phosphate (MurNAc-6-P) etherase